MFGEYNKILVPVDGSEQSHTACQKAIQIAKRNHAHLHLLHVRDTRNVTFSSRMQRDAGAAAGEGQMGAAAFLDDMAREAEAAGIEVKKSLVNGNPMTLIAEAFPEEYGIDLIVLSATGKGALTRALVGSVSDYVVKNAAIDVLIVR